jgi:ligand-binding SRPBCC domain-containing protein
MRTHALRTKTELPRARERVFPFFANPLNLQLLMPPQARFEILRPASVVMQEGALLGYRMRLAGVPFEALTRITVWDPPRELVFTQVKGPCRTWVHQHLFVETPSGTRLHDAVTYELPYFPLGELAAPVLHFQLRRIFAYRSRALEIALG